MTETALVKVTPDQLELLTRTLAPQGATAEELKLYLYDCQRRGVHPLDKLLHFTKRGGKYTPVTSIDFLRLRAAESGECAGITDPVFEEGPAFPSTARVTVYRLVQGQRCEFSATARWAEYYPGDGGAGTMWRKMPHTMLGKCAEALALRKAFPAQLAGLYSAEELDQAGPLTVNTTTGEVIETAATPLPPAPESRDGYQPTGLTGDGLLRVNGITTKDGERNGEPWRCYFVTFSNGREAATFSASIGELAFACRDAQCPVEAILEPHKTRKGKFTLTELRRLDQAVRTVGSDDEAIL